MKPRDWDARVYDRVSGPQAAMAVPVLDRLALRGDETVLDAGCGSGRVTKLLLERLPRGRVIAVDAAPSMVEEARAALGDRAEVIHSDLAELELPERVDAVFSNAVFHWVPDHDALFARLHAALRPGGRMATQCGGAGNVDRFHATATEVGETEPFAEYLSGWVGPWNFAGPEETERRLRDAGFSGRAGLARAPPGGAGGHAGVPAHRLPREPCGPASGGAARPLRGRRGRALRPAAGAGLRAPEHRGACVIFTHNG